jgi:hypothetical protein
MLNTRSNSSRNVRQFALRCIRSVEPAKLALYIPQFLQSVKAKDTDRLSEILVGHAKEDVVFASRMY